VAGGNGTTEVVVVPADGFGATEVVVVAVTIGPPGFTVVGAEGGDEVEEPDEPVTAPPETAEATATWLSAVNEGSAATSETSG
jgi:hypothetical protein